MTDPRETPGGALEQDETGASQRFRPDEHYWPYVQLAEMPDAEEMAALDPDLRAAIFGPETRRFSLTLVFPRFEGADYDRAVQMARAAADYRETGNGEAFRHRARFYPKDAIALRDLFQLVERFHETEVLVDDRPIPFARELWLPLVWFLIPR